MRVFCRTFVLFLFYIWIQDDASATSYSNLCEEILRNSPNISHIVRDAAADLGPLDWSEDLAAQRRSLLPLVVSPQGLAAAAELANAIARYNSDILFNTLLSATNNDGRSPVYFPRVIIGAGPAGLVLFDELRKRGDTTPTLVIDRADRFASNFSRPGIRANSNSGYTYDFSTPGIGPSQGDFNSFGTAVSPNDMILGTRKPTLMALHQFISVLFGDLLSRSQQQGLFSHVLFNSRLVDFSEVSSFGDDPVFKLNLIYVPTGQPFQISAGQVAILQGRGQFKNPLGGSARARLDEEIAKADDFIGRLSQGDVAVQDPSPAIYTYEQYSRVVGSDRFAMRPFAGKQVLVLGQGDAGISIVKHLFHLGPEDSYSYAPAQIPEPKVVYLVGESYLDGDDFLRKARPHNTSGLVQLVRDGKIRILPSKLVDFTVRDRLDPRIKVEFTSRTPGLTPQEVDALVFCAGQQQGNFTLLPTNQNVFGTYTVPGRAEGQELEVGVSFFQGSKRSRFVFGGVGAAERLREPLDRLIDSLYGDLPEDRLATFREPLRAAMLLHLPLVRSLAGQLIGANTTGPNPKIDFEVPPLEPKSDPIEIRFRANPRQPFFQTMDDDAFVRMWLTTLISGNSLLGRPQTTVTPTSSLITLEATIVFERLNGDDNYRIHVKDVSQQDPQDSAPDLTALSRHLTTNPRTLMDPISRRIGPGATNTKIEYVIQYLAPSNARSTPSTSGSDKSPNAVTTEDGPSTAPTNAGTPGGGTAAIGSQAIFIPVPAGNLDVTPEYGETVTQFDMMSTPVTQVIWRSIATLINTYSEQRSGGLASLIPLRPSYFSGISGDDARPVENISRQLVLNWIDGLNRLSAAGNNFTQELRDLIPDHEPGDIYRLPTRPEWLYILYEMAGISLPDLDLNTIIELGWYRNNSMYRTQPVGTKKAILGFFDLVGNVRELSGPPESISVLPGGGWDDSDTAIRNSLDSSNVIGPENRVLPNSSIGFRLARTKNPNGR